MPVEWALISRNGTFTAVTGSLTVFFQRDTFMESFVMEHKQEHVSCVGSSLPFQVDVNMREGCCNSSVMVLHLIPALSCLDFLYLPVLSNIVTCRVHMVCICRVFSGLVRSLMRSLHSRL